MGLRPRPPGGAYNIPTDSLTGFKKPTSKGKKGRGRKGGRKGKEEASTRFNPVMLSLRN